LALDLRLIADERLLVDVGPAVADAGSQEIVLVKADDISEVDGLVGAPPYELTERVAPVDRRARDPRRYSASSKMRSKSAVATVSASTGLRTSCR